MQHLPLIPPKLTPAAKTAETVDGPRHKRMNTGLRCLQCTRELQPPALLGRGWARPKDELSPTSVLPTIDALHIDQGRTAGVKDGGIGLQLPNQLNRAANQQGRTIAAW